MSIDGVKGRFLKKFHVHYRISSRRGNLTFEYFLFLNNKMFNFLQFDKFITSFLNFEWCKWGLDVVDEGSVRRLLAVGEGHDGILNCEERRSSQQKRWFTDALNKWIP